MEGNKMIVGVVLKDGKPICMYSCDPRVALRLMVSACEDIREAIFSPRDKSLIEVVSAPLGQQL